MKASLPEVTYRSSRPIDQLPFEDEEFEIACSNAVFEHLGSDAARRTSLSELLRVAKRVYDP